MASVTVSELSKEQVWCRKLRQYLKLKERRITIGATDEKKLGEADRRAREGLRELAKKNPKAFETLSSRYKSISQQAGTLKTGDENAMVIITQELEVLGKQVERETALATLQGLRSGTKEHGKAQEQYEKANKAYDKEYSKLDGGFQKLLDKAAEYLDELGPMTFSQHSPTLPTLKDKRTRWATAYRDKQRGEFFDYAHALTDLSDISDLYKTALKEIQDLQADAKLQAEYKGRFESKVERIKEVERNLTGHTGLEDDIKLLEKARIEANRVLQPSTELPGEQRYYDAFLELKKYVDKTSKFESTALAKEKKLLDGLFKDPEIKNKMEAVQQALDGLMKKGEELITAAEYEQHQRDIHGVLSIAGKDKRKGLDLLEKKRLLCAELLNERGADRTECNKLLPIVERNLNDLLYQPPPEQLGQFGQWEELLRMVKADIGNCEFDSARAILVSLEKNTTAAVKTCTTKRSDFETLWNDGQHEKMRSFIRTEAPKLREDPSQPVEQTYQLKHLAHAEKRAKSGDFAGAIELLESLHEDTQRQLKQKSFSGSPELTKAQRLVESEMATCRKALEKLTEQLRVAGDTGAAAKEQAYRLQQIETAWNGNKKAAASTDELDADGYITRLKALASDYARVGSNERLLGGSIKGAEHREGLKQFQVALGEVDIVLDQLAGCDLGPRYTALADEREKIESEAPDRSLGFAPALQALGSLKTQIERAIQSVASERETALRDFNSKATTVRSALDELHSAVKDEMKFRQRKFFEPYFKELENEYEGLIGMSRTSSIAMLRQGIVELTAVERRLNQLKVDMDKPVGNLGELVANALGKNDQDYDPELFGIEALFSEDSGPQRDPILSDRVAPTFPLVIAALESLTKELDNKNLKTCRPTLHHLLAEDLKNLASEVTSLAPADALKRLLPFQKQVTQAIETGDTAALRRAEFNTRLKPEVKTAYKELTGYEPEAKLAKLFKDEKAYFAELAEQFSAAKGLIETENKETEALDKMRDLLKKIQQVKQSPGELDKLEREAQQREFAAERDRKQWDMYVKQYNDVTLPRVKEALQADGADKSQYKDCLKLLKKAQDHFKTTGELSSASTLLQLARDRAEAAIKFPLGTAATARGELVKVAARWKKSVTAFNASIDTVIDRIDQAVAEEGISVKQEKDSLGIEELFEDLSDVQQAAKQAARTLNNLKRVFDPNAFDGVISVMATKKVEPREARAAREEGLREVHRYMDIVMNDPVMQRVMQTPRPFGTVEASAIYTALRDLDLNLQRSV